MAELLAVAFYSDAMSTAPTFTCATCGRKVAYTPGALPKLHPFCSDRCRLIDLGKWFSEEYSIDRDVTPDDVPHGHAGPPRED